MPDDLLQTNETYRLGYNDLLLSIFADQWSGVARALSTLTQLISLRTQVMDLTVPERFDGAWEFEFATETPDAYGPVDDPTLVLRMDSAGVPMLHTLKTGEIVPTQLTVDGADQNIWFLPTAINNQ